MLVSGSYPYFAVVFTMGKSDKEGAEPEDATAAAARKAAKKEKKAAKKEKKSKKKSKKESKKSKRKQDSDSESDGDDDVDPERKRAKVDPAADAALLQLLGGLDNKLDNKLDKPPVAAVKEATVDDPNKKTLLADLPEWLGSRLKANGIEELFPIQTAAYHPCVMGKDVVGQARTGTGKVSQCAFADAGTPCCI